MSGRITNVDLADDELLAAATGTGALQWNTFLGGAKRDDVYGVAVGGADVYVAGCAITNRATTG